MKSLSSTLYQARLHSPVDKLTAIGKNLKARDIHCADGIILLTSVSGPIKAFSFVDGAINLLAKAKKKGDFVSLANNLNLSSAGTVAEIKVHLAKYMASLKKVYAESKMEFDEVNFWDSQQQPSFEAMVCADHELIYAARNDTNMIVSFLLEKDGVGVRGVSSGNRGGRSTVCA